MFINKIMGEKKKRSGEIDNILPMPRIKQKGKG